MGEPEGLAEGGRRHSIPERAFRRTYSLSYRGQQVENLSRTPAEPFVVLQQGKDRRRSAEAAGPPEGAPPPEGSPAEPENDIERGLPRANALLDSQTPLLPEAQDGARKEAEARQARIQRAVQLSMIANVSLLVAKVVGFFLSASKSVLASAADSFVDIASQLVLAFAEWKMRHPDPNFPVGRSRYEVVGVSGCAMLMVISTLEVIQASVGDLWTGFRTGVLPQLEFDLLLYLILGVATAVKVALYLYCRVLAKASDSMLALAEDHRNDVISNVGAIVLGGVASQFRAVWWVDPAGACALSLYIICSWVQILLGQVDKVVGKAAPEEFVAEMEALLASQVEVDCLRVYHFGARFMVEAEILLPRDMTVVESHDTALNLQHRLEAFQEVERAFVHVDYARREVPEHKVDRNLVLGAADLFESHSSVPPLAAGSSSKSLHGAQSK